MNRAKTEAVMNELIKIKDVSSKYNVTTRTLRYYEDMGLITSTRTDEYAYRLYDENAVKRIEQILILRKLNIRIKDIERIFAAPGSNVVLEVLCQKADDIDNEVALLHELKAIVLDFVRQIEQADFHNSEQVKLLYEKAKEIEVQLTTPDYVGNSQMTLTPANRLAEVTEKLDDKRITLPTVIKTYRHEIAVTRFIGTKKYEMPADAWNNFDDELLKATAIRLSD
jgi:DNA-binding transcriptional MerR regulator